MRLAGKTALITGAARGIGLAFVEPEDSVIETHNVDGGNWMS